MSSFYCHEVARMELVSMPTIATECVSKDAPGRDSPILVDFQEGYKDTHCRPNFTANHEFLLEPLEAHVW